MKYKNTKVKSKIQEKRISKEIGGKVTIASGALDFQKADVRNDMYLVEAKTTEKPYYPLSLATWKKIEEQALRDGLRIPVMCIDLEDGNKSLAILHNNDFQPLIDNFKDSFKFSKVVPSLYAKKSVRVNASHMDITCAGDLSIPSIIYQNLLFEDKTELVILDWNDFLLIQGGVAID